MLTALSISEMAVPGALLVAAGAVLIFSVALSPEAHDRVTFSDFQTFIEAVFNVYDCSRSIGVL